MRTQREARSSQCPYLGQWVAVQGVLGVHRRVAGGHQPLVALAQRCVLAHVVSWRHAAAQPLSMADLFQPVEIDATARVLRS